MDYPVIRSRLDAQPSFKTFMVNIFGVDFDSNFLLTGDIGLGYRREGWFEGDKGRALVS